MKSSVILSLGCEHCQISHIAAVGFASGWISNQSTLTRTQEQEILVLEGANRLTSFEMH